jgi:hypothetical protein
MYDHVLSAELCFPSHAGAAWGSCWLKYQVLKFFRWRTMGAPDLVREEYLNWEINWCSPYHTVWLATVAHVHPFIPRGVQQLALDAMHPIPLMDADVSQALRVL